VKIVLVHNHYQQPGGEDVVFEQEKQLLQRQGHKVVTYVRDNSEVSSYSGIRRLELASKTVWARDSRRDFSRLLRVEKPDLVHVHNTFLMISPSIYAACTEAQVPVVQTLHNYRLLCPAATFFRDGSVCEECVAHTLWRSVDYGCYRASRAATATVALMLALHRRRQTWSRDVAGYITPTEFARKKFEAAQFTNKRISVKPNFVYPDPGARTGVGDYALFAGRLSPEKRVSVVLSAWARLSNPIPLVIAGGGPDREKLEKLFCAGNQGKNIYFVGSLPHTELMRVIKGARMLIFSSEWYETFGLTIVEAFASGVPVICSRLGAMEELVENERTGLTFAAGDSRDLSEKVDWACEHSEQLRNMGREARREYEAKYTAESNYPILMQVYQHALKAA
jgi:glycosyltransferase involved in cell wall biosynthesis